MREETFMRAFFNNTSLVLHILYTIGLCVCMAINLYTIAKRQNIRHAWIAFIPIFQYYIIGALCEEYVLLGFRIRFLQWVMIFLELLQVVLGILSGILFLPLRILINLLLVLVLHKFFYLFDPRHAVLYAALSILGRLPFAILLFLLRNKPIIMSAGAYPYPFARRRY